MEYFSLYHRTGCSVEVATANLTVGTLPKWVGKFLLTFTVVDDALTRCLTFLGEVNNNSPVGNVIKVPPLLGT